MLWTFESLIIYLIHYFVHEIFSNFSFFLLILSLPQLKAKPDGSWCPSEQGKHGAADILELNRIGLPIREVCLRSLFICL
jgi:hypothetical protein